MEGVARAPATWQGVVYLLVGLLALQAAAGAAGSAAGPEGALLTLLYQPLGRVLLGLTAVGLAAFAVWRLYCAAADPERHGNETKRLFVLDRLRGQRLRARGPRLADGADRVRPGLYRGRPHPGLDRPSAGRAAGPLARGRSALGVAGYGIAQFLRGLGRKVEERMQLGELLCDERRLVVRVGRVGHVARGVVFGIVGALLLRAALAHDASKAGGLGEALQTLERQRYAPVLLGTVALGLAAYGAYQLVKARYRVIAAG